MKFELCVKIILEHEGIYTRDSFDKGGLTKFGISQRAHPDLDITNLTEKDAKEIYKKEYWDFAKCDALPEYTRLMVFDCAVNQGVARSALFLQRACGVTVDGLIGENTFMAIQRISPSLFLYRYSMRRLEAYSSHPQFQRYGKGWFKRLNDITMKSFHYIINKDGLI